MASVITAPQTYDDEVTHSWSIFLAGAIDMGAAVDWQAWVIEQLQPHDLIILNPRRAHFTPDTLDEQIEWELEALERVTTIFMWFPKDAKAPISFFESGLYWRSGKLLIGAEEGFYRRRNLELTGKRYSTFVYLTLEAMISTLLMSKPDLAPKKILSRDGKWYYIQGPAIQPTGWHSVYDTPNSSGMDWLPFAFWDVKKGTTTEATPEEIARYTHRITRDG